MTAVRAIFMRLNLGRDAYDALTMTIDFRSDNTHGASPEITEAVAKATAGRVTSYGEDPFTTRVRPVLDVTACVEVIKAGMNPLSDRPT